MRMVVLPHRREEVPLPLVLGGISLLALADARVVVREGLWLPGFPILCPFRSLTGIPCPTCGGTRALAALSIGDLGAAIRFNPLVALSAMGILAGAGASLAQRLAGWPALRLRIEPREEILWRAAAVILILANWAYLLFHS